MNQALSVDTADIVESDRDSELPALLEDIYQHYNHDFRQYAAASLTRRINWALRKLKMADIAQLRDYIVQAPQNFSTLLQYITVPVSAMFRDPAYFLALRQHVVPVLKTYSSPKIWVAGCCTGEEAYSIAIVLREEGLLERSVIYATDINPAALEQAARGIFRNDQIRAYTENYQRAGGKTAFSDYYHAAYDNAVLDKELRKNIIFAEHSLTTDSVFSEMQLISCRNVLIYFKRELQSATFDLFHESLCRRGFLGLGARETLDFSPRAHQFDNCVKSLRIYQKNNESLIVNPVEGLRRFQPARN
ncbi:MAG: chemotaxis protein methyltransferase CheR [Verrucomicrobiaceae bacterium]|nr:chemotaxis protein methyltransferase CheR [Verrucomicrobiaceae bacterium]